MVLCPNCAHEEERLRLPFFSVTGASGSGKSTLVRRLWRELPECVVLDGDVLWNPKFWGERGAFHTLWLSLAAQISQSGRPVVVCTAAMPDDWRNATTRILVADVHMLALVCDEAELLSRRAARARPRDVEAPIDFVEQTLNFNRVLRERLEHVDTSKHDADETGARVATWVRSHL
jgi:predicted kinase